MSLKVNYGGTPARGLRSVIMMCKMQEIKGNCRRKVPVIRQSSKELHEPPEGRRRQNQTSKELLIASQTEFCAKWRKVTSTPKS